MSKVPDLLFGAIVIVASFYSSLTCFVVAQDYANLYPGVCLSLLLAHALTAALCLNAICLFVKKIRPQKGSWGDEVTGIYEKLHNEEPK